MKARIEAPPFREGSIHEDTRSAIVLRIVACDLGPERMAHAGRLLNLQHANEVMASLFGWEVVDRKFKKVRL